MMAKCDAPPSRLRGLILPCLAALLLLAGLPCPAAANTTATPVLFPRRALGQAPEYLTFIGLGDWGGMSQWPYWTYAQHFTAQRLGPIAARFGTSFILALGDNFYDNGITGDVNDDVSQERFKGTFENMYSAKSLQIPWHIILGNHDWHGNPQAQLDYGRQSSRWTMPATHQSFTKTVGGQQIHFVLFDSVVWTGINGDQNGDHSQEAIDQRQWVYDQLAGSDADWLIVVGHYPVWSIGEHGPTAGLQAELKDVMGQHGVAVYISGHDHSLQHISGDGTGVEYVVSGAGKGCANAFKQHEGSVDGSMVKFFWSSAWSNPDGKGGFVVFRFPSSAYGQMQILYYDSDGTELYSYSKSNPRKDRRR